MLEKYNEIFTKESVPNSDYNPKTPYTNIYKVITKSYSDRSFDKKELSRYKDLCNLVKNMMLIKADMNKYEGDREKYTAFADKTGEALCTRARIDETTELVIVKFPDRIDSSLAKVATIRGIDYIVIIRGKDVDDYSDYTLSQVAFMFIYAINDYYNIKHGAIYSADKMTEKELLVVSSLTLFYLSCGVDKATIVDRVKYALKIDPTVESVNKIIEEHLIDELDGVTDLTLEQLLDDLYILGLHKMFNLINTHNKHPKSGTIVPLNLIRK